MGHSLSANKRERQNVKRRARNKDNKSTLRRELKGFEKALAGKPKNTGEALAKVFSALDTAARRNAIPKGRANRKKARLARKAAKAGA